MYRLIPKMDEILENNQVKKLVDQYSVDFVKSIINDRLDGIRNMIKDNKSEDEIKAEIRNLELDIVNDCNNYLAPRLRRLVNATGTVIHTNLGRSVISERMAKSLVDILTHYSNLEYDIHTGKRGLRYTNIEELITNITGTEAALVVNNNAAAVFLVLSEFAKGGEAIISRGELIEIGGSFRIPDVMEFSGCKLKEIGTTNKTHLYDYERAINEDTRVILKVHTSNYKVVGFTEGVSSTELKELADKYNLPLIEDLGSGVFVDLEKYGLMHEPTVMDSINAGIDIITFSGDKLLGGPQAGIIVGKKKYIDALKKNPMTRALRVDKMTLKLLEEVLKEYIDKDKAHENIPTLNMLTLPIDELKKRSVEIKDRLEALKLEGLQANVCEDYSEVGGGSLPTEKLPTYVVQISISNMSEHKIDEFMRNYKIGIVGRVNDGKYIIDPRTLLDDDIEIICNAFEDMRDRLWNIL